MRKVNIALVTAIAALIALPLGVAPANAVSTETPTIAEMPIAHTAPSAAWTSDRMLAAVPGEAQVEPEEIDMLAEPEQISARLSRAVAAVTIAEPVGPSVPFTNIKLNGQLIPSTMGRLFSVTPNGSDFYCSAAVVNSDSRNLVYTAAHCVYNKQNPDSEDPGKYGPDGWNSGFVFVPAYHEKTVNGTKVVQEPFGQWTVGGGSVFHGWTLHRDRAYDQAILSMNADSSGQEIVDLVGGNGMSYGESKSQLGIEIWGYPRQGYYLDKRDRPHKCWTITSADSTVVADGISAPCDLTPGASGGPWVRAMTNKNMGTVIAVTSGRPSAGQPGANLMHGAPNTANTATLYEHRQEEDSHQ